jgi:hypothetical protein
MAELSNRTPGHILAAIRRKTAVRDAVDDLAAAFGDITPLIRMRSRNALEDLAHNLSSASDGNTVADALALALARALDRALAIADVLARVLARALARVLALARALARDLALARARARDLARALARARDLARDLDLALARDLDLVRDLVCVLALNRARELDRDRDRALARDLDRALARARALARVLLDLARGRQDERSIPDDFAGAIEQVSTVLAEGGEAGRLVSVLDRVRRFLPDILYDKAARERVLDVICRARDDFLNADLAEVDLSRVRLKGVQWTDRTRWPVEWKERIRQDSEESGRSSCAGWRSPTGAGSPSNSRGSPSSTSCRRARHRSGRR